MASEPYCYLQDKLEGTEANYQSLYDSFIHDNGDIDIFADLDCELLDVIDLAHTELYDEERFEVLSRAYSLRSKLRSLPFTVC